MILISAVKDYSKTSMNIRMNMELKSKLKYA